VRRFIRTDPHCLCTSPASAHTAMDIGAFSMSLFTFREREIPILDLSDNYCGVFVSMTNTDGVPPWFHGPIPTPSGADTRVSP